MSRIDIEDLFLVGLILLVFTVACTFVSCQSVEVRIDSPSSKQDAIGRTYQQSDCGYEQNGGLQTEVDDV